MKRKETICKKVCQYVEKWYIAHFDDWYTIFHGIENSKRYGIYHLKGGYKMVDILHDVWYNYYERLTGKDILPNRFSSLPQLMIYLKWYRSLCEEHLEWIRTLPRESLENYEVNDIAQMLEDVIGMASHCIELYEENMVDDTYNKPYIRMKQCLEHGDVKSFIDEINIILNDIPFQIYKCKESEGLYHAIIHAIMLQLGFQVISEKASRLGRLDMLVELEKHVYIFEFKYSKEGKNLSEEAIKQIEDKKYALSYLKSKRKVIAVGVTLGGIHKNAFMWESKELN